VPPVLSWIDWEAQQLGTVPEMEEGIELLSESLCGQGRRREEQK